MYGFVSVPVRLRSNWPHPDASVKNSAQEPNTLAFGAGPHLGGLISLCALTELTLFAAAHLLIALPELLRSR